MQSHKKPTITIIGAGIAGCFTAILLAKRGYKVEIYEGASEDTICNAASKRSFNVTFLGYGLHALQEAGLWEAFKPYMTLLDGSVTQVTKYSKPRFSRFEKEDMPYYSTKRSLLMKLLILQAKQKPLISFHFDTSLVSINRREKTMVIQNRISQKMQTIPCDVILGADGVNSLVRSYIQQGQSTVHTQEQGAWSYKQILIEKEVSKKLALRNNVMHAWTRKYAVLAAFPQENESFAAILMLPKKSFASLTSPTSIKKFVKENFPTLEPITPALIDGILQYPEGSFVMVHTDPWYYKDFMAVIGDAAHGFFPFFGQGMSAAFGDGLALVRLLDRHGHNWEKIFPLYQENRKNHMDTLGELSKQGLARFRRNKIADYDTIYDKLEFMMHMLFPKHILPPIFVSIGIDPDHTADHLEGYLRQKRILALLGFPFIAHMLTAIVALKETFTDGEKKILYKTRFLGMVKNATKELKKARNAVIPIAHRKPKTNDSSIDLFAIAED